MASTTETAPRRRTSRTRQTAAIVPVPLHEKIYLATEELAVYLSGDISVRTLERWRVEGIGPDFIPVTAKMVRYRREAVDAWLLGKERTNRAEAA